MNKSNIEVTHGKKRFIVHRLNNIRSRNGKSYHLNRRAVL